MRQIFFNCYLAVSRPSLDHSRGDSLTNPMLITAFVQFRPKGHREPRNEIGSLSPAEHLVGFEPGTLCEAIINKIPIPLAYLTLYTRFFFI